MWLYRWLCSRRVSITAVQYLFNKNYVYKIFLIFFFLHLLWTHYFLSSFVRLLYWYEKNVLQIICMYVYFAHSHSYIVSNLSEDSYDYVFGGRRKTPPATRTTTTLKLTSPPVRLRPEGKHRAIKILFIWKIKKNLE